ncbi:uncharacterized protein LOC122387421 [Amphibalanus amphitrite]|uniref:uncharacterized protein LOC122387421 n=1 Tax=Amphibalanus amphitrite TaxID=1232801 RepID=UPI001C91D160|nr:uncharacterized protein LOC122387421 [Amphibalanus amphitrite]
MELLRSDLFKTGEFDNIIINFTESEVLCRTNVNNEEELATWKELFCRASQTSLNVVYTRHPSGERIFFSQKLVCQFAVKRHKGVKKHSTGCPFRMHIQIKRASERKVKDDALLSTHPCVIVLTGEHNHTGCAKSLKELRVLPQVEKEFFEYFRRGMRVPEAQRYHRLKMGLGSELWTEEDRGDMNPSLRAVAYMQRKWAKATAGGCNDEDMLAALDRYAATTNSVIEIERSSAGSFCVALVTPFMKRVHALREAGEVVFVDATTSVDRLNTTIVPLLCCSPAGALPLGVVFSSSQDEAQLTTGFRLLQKDVGNAAFNGRGHPSAFITDNCDAERRALRTVWPEAEQFLSIAHVLQEVWRWLLDPIHGVPRDQRQELMGVVRKLVYAESPERFQALLAAEHVAHQGFARYMMDLFERRAEWAIACRQASALRGNLTNNYAEATMCIIKDIVMKRCKARNACELVMIMDEIYNGYMVQRLIDFALDRRQSKRLAPPTMNETSITRVDDHHFRVTCESDPNVIYNVAMDLGVCSCPQGQSDGICKHQLACSHVRNMTLPQVFNPMTAENRRWLMSLALGEDKASDAGFVAESSDVPTSEKGATVPTLLPPSVDDSGHSGEEAGAAIWDDDDLDAVECVVAGLSSSANASETDNVGPSELQQGSPVGQKPSTELIDSYLSTMRRVLVKYGDGQTSSALVRAIGTVAALKTSDQLNSYLQSAEPPSECLSSGCAARGTIRPTAFSLWPEDRPFGAGLGGGRRLRSSRGAAPPAKRPRSNVDNVIESVASGKALGAG